jgi:two-component system sensor histidine kinase MtrB
VRVPGWARRLRAAAAGSAPASWVRRSLSVRIAVSMTAAAAVILVLFAAVTSAQLRSSVFENRRDIILDDASLRFSTAQSAFDQSTASTTDQVQEAAREVIETARGSAAGAGAESVLLIRPPDSPDEFRINEIGSAAMRAVVTDDLREDVRSGDHAYWQSVRVPADTDGEGEPGIAVGMMVSLPRAGDYEMYIVYSLQSEQTVIDMVMRVLGLGALPIIIALPTGVFWVLYHLLRPVRQTARAASELADGDLDTRVDAQGDDEMAQLGQAFNNMASSLQNKIAEYDELSRLQQRFVSDVSHELRTPLTTIRMAEDVIWEDRGSFGPATKRSAELLHEQVDRFESMLADLLEISRYDAQSALLDAESADLRAVVRKVVDANAELAATLGVEVRVEEPDQRCAAEVDVRRIERVLRNLLVNAVEHADGLPVVITVAASDTDVAVRVRDHGVGMSEQTIAHVFDRFFRADPARTRTTGGTGLGLSIAREDVALHHGVLEAWGELGVGSSFLVVVPRVAGDEVASRPLALWEEEA